MNVLSLFDGISCARLVLCNLGLTVTNYWASEIDHKAICVSRRNWPNVIQLGDVRKLKLPSLPIDLLIGGSPCQDLSISRIGRQGLQGPQSSLFFEYVRIKNKSNPKFFLFENVASMSTKDKEIITNELGVEPYFYDSKYFSPQERKRLYWTNIPQNPPPH
jgi:DNA-cytosine methyltransferase